ncbi:MAG: methanesulfonate monooxygenase [Alphaproteobacteria bacterium]|nr:methanesulfonate monooxygenase [Alphaproteobacteria bacterium]
MTEQNVRELVYRSCLALDREDFDGFLALCDPALHYVVTAYSPEIRKEMTWMEQDLAGMKALLAMVPQHLRRTGSLHRHVSVYQVEAPASDGTIGALSSFLVTHTALDGGSRLFAVGHYHDRIAATGGRHLLKTRRAHLETRDLGIGLHIPI